MTNRFAETNYALRQRMAKASAVCAQLATEGCSEPGARSLPPSGRRAVERRAGVPRCSDATWEVVFTLLRGSEGL